MAPAERSSKRRRVEDITEAFMEGDNITISSARQTDPLANLHLPKRVQKSIADVSKSLKDAALEDPTGVWRHTGDEDASYRRRSKRGLQSSSPGDNNRSTNDSPYPLKGGEGLYQEDPSASRSATHGEKRSRKQQTNEHQSNGVSQTVNTDASTNDPDAMTTQSKRRSVTKSKKTARAKPSRQRISAVSKIDKKRTSQANGRVFLPSSKRKSTLDSDVSEASDFDDDMQKPSQNIHILDKVGGELPAKSGNHGTEDEILAQTARFRSSAGYGAQFTSTYIADGDESDHEELSETKQKAVATTQKRQGKKSKFKSKRQVALEKEQNLPVEPAAAFPQEKSSSILSQGSAHRSQMNDLLSSSDSALLQNQDKTHNGSVDTDLGDPQRNQHQNLPFLPRISTSDTFLAQALKMPGSPSLPRPDINDEFTSLPVGSPRIATVQYTASKPGPEDEKRYTPPPMNEEQASMMGSFSIFEKGFSPSEAALSMLGRSKKLNKAKQTGAPSISNPGRPEGWVPCHPGRGPMSQDDPRRAIDPKLPKDQQKRMTAFRIELTKPKPLYTEVKSSPNSESPFLMRKRNESPVVADEHEGAPTSKEYSPNYQADGVKHQVLHSIANVGSALPSSKSEDITNGAQQQSVEVPYTSSSRKSKSTSPGAINAGKSQSPTLSSPNSLPTVPAGTTTPATAVPQPQISLSTLFASLVNKPTSMKPPGVRSPGIRQTDMVYQPSPATIYNPAATEVQNNQTSSFVGRIVKDAQGNNVQETPIPVAQPFREFELSFNDSSGQKVNITLNDQLVNTILKDRGPGESAHAMKERLRRELLLSGAVITDTTSQAEAAQFYDIGEVAIQRYKSLMSKTASAQEDNRHVRGGSTTSEQGTNKSTTDFPSQAPMETSKTPELNEPAKQKTSRLARKTTPAEFRPGPASDSVPGFRPINAQSWSDTQSILRQAEHDLVSSPVLESHSSNGNPQDHTPSPDQDRSESHLEPTPKEQMNTQQLEDTWEPWSTIKKPRAHHLPPKKSIGKKRQNNASKSGLHESESILQSEASQTPPVKEKASKRRGKGIKASRSHDPVASVLQSDASNRSNPVSIEQIQSQENHNNESDDEDTIMVAGSTSRQRGSQSIRGESRMVGNLDSNVLKNQEMEGVLI